MSDWAGETGVEYVPRFINPYVARSLGVLLLPSVMFNPDRSSDQGAYSAKSLLDHSGQRMTRWPESMLLNHLDQAIPSDAGDVSVSRVRYMGLGIDGGWHRDTNEDYRFIVSLLGGGDFYYEVEDEISKIWFRPGDAIKLDNTQKNPHKALSRSKHRVVLVYGREAA